MSNLNSNGRTIETDNYELAMAALADALEAAGISSLTICSDDYAMAESSDDDLMLWADDLEARIGLNVDAFRSALLDYIAGRAP